MSRKALGIAALAVLVVLSSVVLSSATVRVQNLYAWVEGVNMDREDAAYNIKPAEAIDVEVGEEVEVSLWAETGGDEDEPVSASFSVAAGRENIQITGTGDNSFKVRVKGGGGGTAQIYYSVDGDYNMKGGLREGRITFEIE
jgi:predicted extracellular nuclease